MFLVLMYIVYPGLGQLKIIIDMEGSDTAIVNLDTQAGFAKPQVWATASAVCFPASNCACDAAKVDVARATFHAVFSFGP